MSDQPKPTGEWTEGMVFAYWESEDWQGLADAHNAALAAERRDKEVIEHKRKSQSEAYDRIRAQHRRQISDWVAAAEGLQQQLAAEREKVERMTKAYMVCNQDWQTVTEQLSDERKKVAERHKLCVDFETKWKAEKEKSRVLGNMTDGFRTQLAAAQAAMIDPCPICGKELRHYNTCPQKHKDTAALDATIAAAQQPLVDALKFVRDNANQGVLKSVATDTLEKVEEGK